MGIAGRKILRWKLTDKSFVRRICLDVGIINRINCWRKRDEGLLESWLGRISLRGVVFNINRLVKVVASNRLRIRILMSLIGGYILRRLIL